jgi:hypothetical protein
MGMDENALDIIRPGDLVTLDGDGLTNREYAAYGSIIAHYREIGIVLEVDAPDAHGRPGNRLNPWCRVLWQTGEISLTSVSLLKVLNRNEEN